MIRFPGWLLFVSVLPLFVGCNPPNELNITPYSNQWQKMAPLPTPRVEASAAAVGNKIYIFGGANSGGSGLNVVEEYDTTTNTWTNCGGACDVMPQGRWEGAAATLNGIVYYFGGLNSASAIQSTVYAFNPSQPSGLQWTNCGGTCDAISAGGTYQASAHAVNGVIYLIGGQNPSQTVLQFNPSLGSGLQWSNCGGSCASFTHAGGRGRAQGTVTGGLIYLFGGFDGTAFAASFEVYNPLAGASGTWTNCGGACPIMLEPGGDSVQGVIGGLIYYVDGITDRYMDSYNPATNTWTACGGQCPQKPTPTDWGSGAVVNGRLYVMGGVISTTGVYPQANEMYVP